MKKASILLIWILCSCSSVNYHTVKAPSSPANLPNDLKKEVLTYSRSLNLEGATISDIFTKSEAWAASFLMDPDQAINYKNASKGILIAKYQSTNELHYLNTIKITCSPGSATISISNPVNKEGENAINKSLTEARAKLILQDWQAVTASYFSYLNQN